MAGGDCVYFRHRGYVLGVINVAATNPHHPLTNFILSTTMDKSVSAHARGITAPHLDDARMVMEGFRHYREMCVGCHLASGIDSTEMSEGLMPRPPKLQEEVEEWKPEELFRVTKNGVKMTGMPAWGPTHSDARIWAIVAFLEQLPHMTAEQYQEMDRTAGAGEGDESATLPPPGWHVTMTTVLRRPGRAKRCCKW